MKISDWLFETMTKLGEAAVDSPRRDALVLLEDTLQKDRTWVLAHADYNLSDDQLATVNKLIQRRIKREPLAYIRKKAWFYGRFFYVDERVLIPRPESENIITFAKEINPGTIVDIGTGSGCLAITLALELPEARIVATDTSSDALEVARKNALQHNVKVVFKKAYLTDSMLQTEAPELLVANLPYVPEGLITSPEIQTEPEEALFAGEKGMDLYESLWAQLTAARHKPLHVITEALESQHTHMDSLAAKAGYRILKTDGLIQEFELLEA